MAASDLRTLAVARIEQRGAMTLEAFMDLALYHPALGYYARASRRTGRAGDFFTSVDVGPLFGELLARQLAEMWELMDRPARFDFVEAGAGDGRLTRDVLDAAAGTSPAFYRSLAVHLVDASAAARSAQPATLAPHADRIGTLGAALPDRVEGVIFANELLDALPCHVVVMTRDGLREVGVDVEDGRLIECVLPPSSPALGAYLDEAGVRLEPGWRAEINLRAQAWVADAGRRLARGFLLLIDYGHPAAELYSAGHAGGTLTSMRRHVVTSARGDAGRPAWLDEPGAHDMTAHVDLTAVERAAAGAGLSTLARLDQTYFLLGLGLPDLAGRAEADPADFDVAALKRRLALKTLLLPGGLGSTQKVLIFGKHVGAPQLCSARYPSRLT